MVDFEPKSVIKNYTDKNNAVYTIYPIYDVMKYDILCEYNSTNNKKCTYVMKDNCVSIKSDLPKIYTLPIGANSYGWFYNDNIVYTTLDLDKYVKNNGDTLIINYKSENGVYAYTDEEFNQNVRYKIKYSYPGSESKLNNVKTYITKIETVKINDKRILFEFENMYKGTSDTGWYFGNKKVKSTSDIVQFVKFNDEIININYKFFKNIGGGAASTPEHTDDNNGPPSSNRIDEKHNEIISDNKFDDETSVNDHNSVEDSYNTEVSDIKYDLTNDKNNHTNTMDTKSNQKNSTDTESNVDEESENIKEDFVCGPKYIDDYSVLICMHGYAGPIFSYNKYSKINLEAKETYEQSDDNNTKKAVSTLLNTNISSLIKLFNENKFASIVSIVLILILIIV